MVATTTTGQHANIYMGGSASDWNVVGSWSNGLTFYTTGFKNGNLLYIPANGYRGNGNVTCHTIYGYGDICVLNSPDLRRYMADGEFLVLTSYGTPIVNALQVRAVHD